VSIRKRPIGTLTEREKLIAMQQVGVYRRNLIGLQNLSGLLPDIFYFLPAVPMKQEQRLRRSDDFQRVRHLGQSRTNTMMVLAYLPNNLDHNRVGFVVSKRLGRAVKRNRIKRQMREAVRSQMAGLKPGFDLVFIARQPIKEASFTEISQVIMYLLKLASLLCNQEQVE
jgi:ribonuclease P protein component